MGQIGVNMRICLGNSHGYFQLHRFIISENIAESFFFGGGYFFWLTLYIKCHSHLDVRYCNTGTRLLHHNFSYLTMHRNQYHLWCTAPVECKPLRPLLPCITKLNCMYTGMYTGWLGGVMVRTLDLWLAVAGSNPGHDIAWLFLR